MQKDETDLRARTKDFALRVIRMFSALPKTTEAQLLGKQLLRSGTSIGANYREAYRGRSKAEFIAKCGDSLCARLKKRPIGLNSLSKRGSSPRRSCSLFDGNATSSPRFS